ARGVDRTSHDRQLPSLLSLTKNAGKVRYMLPRSVVAARGCHCKEVPAGLLVIAFPRRILGLGGDGTTGRVSTQGPSPPRCSGEGHVRFDCPRRSRHE